MPFFTGKGNTITEDKTRGKDYEGRGRFLDFLLTLRDTVAFTEAKAIVWLFKQSTRLF
jgi:hypothetical protein